VTKHRSQALPGNEKAVSALDLEPFRNIFARVQGRRVAALVLLVRLLAGRAQLVQILQGHRPAFAEEETSSGGGAVRI